MADEEAMLSRPMAYIKVLEKLLESKSVSKILGEKLLTSKPIGGALNWNRVLTLRWISIRKV